MLSGRDDPGESRMGEISMSGSTRERGAAVIGLWLFHPVLSSLLYWFNQAKVMGKESRLTPRSVPRVETKHRRIMSKLPHPDSLPTLEKLRQFEPQSMRGQPPLVWDRAEDIFVYDKHGNKWLDWSSGVLVTNCGHGAPEVRRAIIEQVNSGLLHNYVFPSEERAQLAELLIELAPKGLDKV